MPSTITTYHTFVQATKARASQVNTNFSNYRGDLLPIYENTAAASNHEHHLGATDHRWLNAYIDNLDLRSSTTTAGLQLRGDTAVTAGMFIFQIASITVAKIGSDGVDGAYLKASSVSRTALGTVATLVGVTFTASGTWTAPASGEIMVYGIGGGGGGGGGQGGAAGAGGGGGAACRPFWYPITVAAGDVLSITIGAAGAHGNGGNAGGSAGTNGTTGGASQIIHSGVTLASWQGADPGLGANGSSGATGGAYGIATYIPGGQGGDDGSNPGVAGGHGGWNSGGAGGTSTGGGGGGGGASSNYNNASKGGAGGVGTNNVGGAGGAAAGKGCGGGGGAGANGGFAAGNGSDGTAGQVEIYYMP